MSSAEAKKGSWRSFPPVFWVVVMFEFFERGAYYGLMSVLSVYLVSSTHEGGLGFSKPAVGTIKATIQSILYLLPILAGAMADRFGYRRSLFVAFSLLSTGYFLAGNVTTYGLLFGALLVMALGAGTFKPIISGTIARSTDESNSGLGFGIFYWTINLGAFLFPLVLVTYLKTISWRAVFMCSAISTGAMLIPTLLLFKEPARPPSTKSLKVVLSDMFMVIRNFRFILMIVIYSGFWVLYFQQFDTVLWYLKDHVDTAPLDAAVNGVLSSVGVTSRFKFEAQHVTVLNAGTIILLQLIISSIVKKRRALPTMVVGVAIGTAGMALLAFSTHIYVLVAGMVVFSIGEMTAHPKYISYVGQIAPEANKATYMGYAFLYGVIGSLVGNPLGAGLYVHFVDHLHQPRLLWLVFSGIGVATMAGLILYDKKFAPRSGANGG